MSWTGAGRKDRRLSSDLCPSFVEGAVVALSVGWCNEDPGGGRVSNLATEGAKLLAERTATGAQSISAVSQQSRDTEQALQAKAEGAARVPVRALKLA